MSGAESIEIPAGLAAAVEQRGPEWERWLTGLPALAARFLADWELRVEGPSLHGYTALVLPVVGRGGRDRGMLKLAFPDEETEHEALALQHWAGRGAATLIRANPRHRVMLLERLGPADLGEEWDVRACEVVGELYGALHRPAPAQLRPLSAYVAALADRLAALPRGVPVPPRLVDQARSLARSFAADEATDGTLIHGDLHYGNVLAAPARAGDTTGLGWRVIDPKPLSGDPHYELAPLLTNRFDELAGRVREGLRDRFFATLDAAGLDEQRAKDWVVVRMLDLACQRIEEPAGASGPGRISDHDWFTRCVAIAKAVQD
ncbi:aminoglycoside phosphotransferase family protein [Nocardioides sp.]|uniref:aminoglycoside phosphotransferase family protein n=1 Tax=Nocardioides sp. TaxID=35761 RepID=UPI0026237472|nr:aminoglycoside phosphotransferase family protein [Nocardioides sp.]